MEWLKTWWIHSFIILLCFRMINSMSVSYENSTSGFLNGSSLTSNQDEHNVTFTISVNVTIDIVTSSVTSYVNFTIFENTTDINETMSTVYTKTTIPPRKFTLMILVIMAVGAVGACIGLAVLLAKVSNNPSSLSPRRRRTQSASTIMNTSHDVILYDIADMAARRAREQRASASFNNYWAGSVNNPETHPHNGVPLTRPQGHVIQLKEVEDNDDVFDHCE